MIELATNKLILNINNRRLYNIKLLTGKKAKRHLSKAWDVDKDDLSHYLAVFYKKNKNKLSRDDSFITLSFIDSGYIIDSGENIDIGEAEKQIKIDLEIINRESRWSKEESVYFDKWWPTPKIDREKYMLEFGVSLKDFHNKVFNRTINIIILTRFGYLSINYSLSEKDIANNKPLSYYQNDLNKVVKSLVIKKGYRFQDIDKETDTPSRSKMINLLLSAEIF